jgi:hypothetical protein
MIPLLEVHACGLNGKAVGKYVRLLGAQESGELNSHSNNLRMAK